MAYWGLRKCGRINLTHPLAPSLSAVQRGRGDWPTGVCENVVESTSPTPWPPPSPLCREGGGIGLL
ncbi:MAG: hypothetical protein U9Q82_08200, partial [Chloroflexota bacterium]|nr:hypothetical protein [Chloroflexota bacterium]